MREWNVEPASGFQGAKRFVATGFTGGYSN